MQKIGENYPDLMKLDNSIPEIQVLQNNSQHLFFDHRSAIYKVGQPSEYIYQLIDGIIIKSISKKNDKRQILEFKFKGALFGFAPHSTHKCQATAIGDVYVIKYPVKALNEALRVSPELAMQINALLMRDIDLARYHAFTIGRCNARQAIARFLMELRSANTEKSRQTHTIELPMRRSDIADYLGLTVETVSRILSRLRADGTIAFSNPYSVEVLSWNKLLASVTI